MAAYDPGCVKTCPRESRIELRSLVSSFGGTYQSSSFLIQRNRDKRSTRKFDLGVFTQPRPKGDTDASLRQPTSARARPRRFSLPSAGPPRCAGSAAPARKAPRCRGRRRCGRWANTAPLPPSAPRETCRPAAHIRIAPPHWQMRDAGLEQLYDLTGRPGVGFGEGAFTDFFPQRSLHARSPPCRGNTGGEQKGTPPVAGPSRGPPDIMIAFNLQRPSSTPLNDPRSGCGTFRT
jgi:hypothetical protein